jgi:hypothetical protein
MHNTASQASAFNRPLGRLASMATAIVGLSGTSDLRGFYPQKIPVGYSGIRSEWIWSLLNRVSGGCTIAHSPIWRGVGWSKGNDHGK